MKWILLAALGLMRGLAVAFFAGGIWAYNFDGEGSWLFFVGLVLLLLARLVGLPSHGRAGVLLAASMLTGLGLGYVVYDVLQNEELERVWAVEADSPNSLAPKGHWSVSDTLVRVRSDGAFAHDLKDGKQRWAHELPRPQVVCATSRSADGGVGLLSYTVDDATCGRVLALDLASGRVLWERTVKGIPNGPGGIETGSGVAVVAAASGSKVFDLRTGAPRRSLGMPSRCSFESGVSAVAVGGGRIAATFVCTNGSSRLGMVELGGRGRWSTDLVSHPLAGGEPWSVHFEDGIKAVSLTGSELFVLSEPGISEHLDLTSLDPGSGAETRRLTVGYAAPSGWRPDLLVTTDRILFVLQDPLNETGPEILAFATGER